MKPENKGGGEMKTLQNVKEDLAHDHGFKSWREMYLYTLISADELINIVAKRYAAEAIREAAERAKKIKTGNSGSYYDASVDKQSILNLISELK